MKKQTWSVVHPSSLVILLLLLALSLATAPVAAQGRPDCISDSSVMGWAPDGGSGHTFVMTKDCQTRSNGVLHIKNNKTFTIDGKGFTIYAADKSHVDDRGTVFHFDGGSNITLTLKNLTIAGGGTATGSNRAGNNPDPAINLRKGTLNLDNVTIRDTRGGAIVIRSTGTLNVKNSTFTGNQVSGAGSASLGSAITAGSGSTVTFEGTFTVKNNTGGAGAIRGNGATINITAVTCNDQAGNRAANNADVLFSFNPAIAASWVRTWNAIPLKSSGNCPGDATATATATATSAPPSGGNGGGNTGGGGGMAMGQMGMDMAKTDGNYGRRVQGTLGLERSAYYRSSNGRRPTLQIYRIDGNSVGHWVMDVSQAEINALGGPGCVASSPDGRYAVRVWASGDVTISDGPDHENKVFHNTLMGGVGGAIIATETTYSSTPPGVGCPGYMG